MRALSRVRRLIAAMIFCLSMPAFAGGKSGESADHVPDVSQINWIHGVLGEKEGAEPSLLWRPPGMPAPLGALIFNAAVLYGILIVLLKKPIAEGLRKRKSQVLSGMQEAARMKQEAEEQLRGYQERLKGLDQEIARIQLEMRLAAEAERTRVLDDAKERRRRMEREARLAIDQELSMLRSQLIHETLTTAISSAERKLRERLGVAEQQALAERYLNDVKKAAPELRGRV